MKNKSMTVGKGSKSLWNQISQYFVIIAVCALALYTAIVSPQFATLDNFQNLLRQFGALSLVSIGMTFIIISGYFDLSVVGMFSLISIVTCDLASRIGEIQAILIGVALGVGCGLLESFILIISGARNGADSTFVTYGIGTAYGAMALLYSNGQTMRLSGSNTPIMEFLGWGQIGSIPVSFFVFLIAIICVNIFLMNSKTGTEIRMMGGNREATRLAGISNAKNTVIVFAMLGLMTAIGSIIAFTRTTQATPACGVGYDSNTILAVVIGGTRLCGGVGSALRTTIGVILVTVLSNALNLIGLSTYMCEVVKGAFLVIAIWLDYRRG